MRINTTSKALLLVPLLIFLGITFTNTPSASAAYDGARLIDNDIFLDANSMSKDQIQSFLINKESGLSNKNFTVACWQSAQVRQWYTNIGAPCDSPVPASHIIYYASQIYGINPKVVLATLQKEQSLITAKNPTDRQLSQAMGYGCPTTGTCDDSSNFSYQIDNGTWVLRKHYERASGNMNWWKPESTWTCGNKSNDSSYTFYRPGLVPGQAVTFYDGLGYRNGGQIYNYVVDGVTKTGGYAYRTYTIANAATSSFYCYTPHAYNNPQGLYGRSPFGTTGQYYSGSYNFVYFYELWFGSTLAYVFNGVDYSGVFDANYYLNNNADVKSAFGNNSAAAFNHFVTSGMKEGRQGNADFNVFAYRNSNPDLRWAFGTNLTPYYWHFTVTGRLEGRTATGNISLQPVTVYGGVDYSNIYDYNTYLSSNHDIRNVYTNDDTGALWHFVHIGMGERRTSSPLFNYTSYAGRYPDLRAAYGSTSRLYYLHYNGSGKAEGRTATSNILAGTTTIDGVNYSNVYNWDYYAKNNPDIWKSFGLNDSASLRHFVTSGMKEGRQGNADFNVTAYKSKNVDLRQAFGNDLKLYYLHYMNTGKAEGRSGV